MRPCFFGCAECLPCSWRAVSFPASGLILRALRLCYDNNFRGANMCSITARAHTDTVRRNQREPKKVCLAKFHAISASKIILLSPRCWTRDGCCSHPFRIIPFSLSLISKSFVLYSESPASLLLPSSSCPFLFIAFLPHPSCLHLLCSCGVLATSLSQLSITGSPLLLRLSDCAVIAPMHFRRLRIVTFYCLPLCHLSASSKINYPSNKTITAEPRDALFASYRAELFCNHGDCEWNDRGRRKERTVSLLLIQLSDTSGAGQANVTL